MHRVNFRLAPTLVLAAFLATACKSGEQAKNGDDSAAAVDSAAVAAADQPSSSPAANAAAAGGTASAPAGPSSLTAADVDRWKRGMDAELVAVRDAATQMKAAKNGNDSLTALTATQETATQAAGARAAGVDEERYNLIRSTFSPLAAYLAPLELEMNVKDMPPTMVEAMKKNREQSLANASAGVPPAVIDALRPRAAELRKQELTLVGERLKAAGIAR